MSARNLLLAVADFLRICGTHDPIIAVDLQHIYIGCLQHSLDEWRETAVRDARHFGYTPERIAEYQRHLEYIADWFAARGIG